MESESELRLKASQLEDEAMRLANSLARALQGSGREGLGSLENLDALAGIEKRAAELGEKIVALKVAAYGVRQATRPS